MSKRINVYLSDDDISILGDIGGKELIKLAKKGLSDTVHVSVPLSSSDGDDGSDSLLSILEKIYDDTQKIVGEIEKKNTEQKIKSSIMKGGTKDMSDAQSVRYNSTYEKYKNCFKNNNSRGTDSKFIEDLYVFEPGKNFLNEYLHKNLGKLVLESDVDWTLYMSDRLYNILSSNNK